MEAERLIFSLGTAVRFGGNTFIDVPVILQVEETPIIETVKVTTVDQTTQFSIYNKDGDYLAKVTGNDLRLTDAGKRSGLTLRRPDKMTVCELGGQTLFEVRRDAARRISVEAELYSPTGIFVKSKLSGDDSFVSIRPDGTFISGAQITGNVFQGCRIGIWVRSNGFVIGYR